MTKDKNNKKLVIILISCFVWSLLFNVCSDNAMADVTLDHLYALLRDDPPEQLPFPPANLNEWLNQRDYYYNRMRDSLNLPPDSKRTEWPLNARFTKTDLDYSDYYIKHVVFESRPSIWVTANLYIPKGVTFPVPAVLYCHGHTRDGKAASGYQVSMINFAKKGYVVLSVDCIGMGERVPAGHDPQRTSNPCYNQYLAGNSTCGLEVWDNIRAIDYLCSLTQWVDPTKIGVTGRSGGGNQTFNVAVMDPRVVCAAPICAVCTYRGTIITGAGMCMCESVPNVRRYAEAYQVISLCAPRVAFLLGATIRDQYFPIAGSREAYNEAKKVYNLYGAGDKLTMKEIDATHTSTQEMRETVYGWFKLHLKAEGDGSPDPEISVTAESISNLNCGYPAESIGTLTSVAYDLAVTLPPDDGIFSTSSEFYTYKNQLKSDLKGEVLGFDLYMSTDTSLNSSVTQHQDMGTYWKDTVTFDSESDITLTGYLYYNKDLSSPAPAVVSIPSTADVQYLLNKGFVVFSVELRPDITETWGDTKRASIVLGCGVFSMRVWDVIRSVDYLCSRTDIVNPGEIGCIGKTTYDAMYILYAAGLDDRIKACVSESPLVSYKAESSAESAWYDWDYHLYQQRILKYADVSQLASIVAPRSLLISNCRDTGNNLVILTDMQTKLNSCVKAYQLLNSDERLYLTASGTDAVYADWLNNNLNISPEPTKLLLSANPEIVEANASATSVITAKICNKNDQMVRNSTATVTFTLTSGPGNLINPTVVQASGGIATVTYKSDTTAGTATITATSVGLSQGSVNIGVVVNSSPTAPTNLLCNGQTNPTGLTDFTPDLSWTFNDPNSGSGDVQSAYRLLVADSQSSIDSNNGNMWDTNKITSSNSTVEYAGTSLQGNTQYYWKVMTWDSFDAQGPYSQVATFTTSDIDPRAYYGIPLSVPGQIEIEDFDLGGEGVAYHDAEPANQGGAYRTSEGVDVENCSDTGGGYNIGWTSGGEWLEYTVYVAVSGTYKIEVRAASSGAGNDIHIEFGQVGNLVNKTGTMSVPDTGGWQNWQIVTKTGVSLSAGKQIMRLAIDGGGSGGNFNYINIVEESVTPKPPSISVNKTALDFGEVEIGNTSTLDFEITNTEGGILSGSISTDKPWIEVQPTSFKGNSIVVNVTVDNSILNQSEGEHTGTISITSNGGDIDVAVQLAATCVLAKPNPYDPSEGPLTFFGDGISTTGETRIRIYTLEGGLVADLSTNMGNRIFWDGKNEDGTTVVNGIYMYIYESPKEKGIGKFTVIKR